MSSFSAPAKVAWIIRIQSSWENIFYPSIVKKIKNSEAIFNQNFHAEFLDLNQTLLEKIFMPLYEQQIASRPSYHLDKDQIKNHIIKYMNQFPFYLWLNGRQ